MRLNQIKPIQVKSRQMRLNQIKSIQIMPHQMRLNQNQTYANKASPSETKPKPNLPVDRNVF